MTPTRSLAEVKRSRDANRAELQRALADLRASAQRATDIPARRDQLMGVVSERREHFVEQAVERVQSSSGELTAGALAVGFVAGGGVSGTLHLPVKLVRVTLHLPVQLVALTLHAPAKLVRVTLRRPSSKSRLEAAMRQDRHSRQLGRALAAVAAADGQLRSRRRRLTGMIRPTPRRLLMLGSAGGGIFMAVSDQEKLASFQQEALALFEKVRDEVSTRLEQVGK